MPCPVTGIRAVRQWILDHARDKLVMFDDDLRIYYRTEDNKFKRAGPNHVISLMASIGDMLDQYAHGGVAERFMAHTRPRGHVLNKRYFHILCYNKRLFPRPYPAYRVETGEDHDMNLQLLKSGRPGFFLTEWAHDDKPWAPGGCNTWRTREIHEQSVYDLAKYHSDVITVCEPTRDMKSHGDASVSMKIGWAKAARNTNAQE